MPPGSEQLDSGSSTAGRQETIAAIASSFIRWGAPLSRAIRVRALVLTLITSFVVLLTTFVVGVPLAIAGGAVDVITGITNFITGAINSLAAEGVDAINASFAQAGITIGGTVIPGVVVEEHIGGFVAGIAIAAVTAWAVNFALGRIGGPSPLNILRGGG